MDTADSLTAGMTGDLRGRGDRTGHIESTRTAGTQSRDIPPTRPDLLAVGRHRLTAVIEARLQDRCGVPAAPSSSAGGASIIVGVSGGADSVALLLACAALRDRGPRDGQRDDRPLVRPVAVHVHHHLRESADADARFVVELCAALNIPCRVAHVEPGRLAGNMAANARRLRYCELAHAARESGAMFIAVAHHADDQLETMLMALCRGSGLAGLRGLCWRRRLALHGALRGGSEPLWLVRPLLGSSHADCEDLCRAAGVNWRDDPSNVNAATVRGRLRREVIPTLHSLWPGCAWHASIAADQLGAAHELVERELDRVFGPPLQRSWPREALRSLPVDLIAAGLLRAVRDVEFPPAGAQRSRRIGRTLSAAARTIASLDTRPKQFTLAPGCRLTVTAHVVHLHDAPLGQSKSV